MGAAEIKSSETIASDYFDLLNRVAKEVPEIFSKAVVDEDTTRQSRSTGDIAPVHDLCEVLKHFEAKPK